MSDTRNALMPTAQDLANPLTQAQQFLYQQWLAKQPDARRLMDFDPSDPAQRAAMPDLGPSAAYDPNRNLGQQAQNALLGQAWQSNSLPASATQYYGDDDPVAQQARRNMEMRANPGAYDAVINAGLARQAAPPSLPSYAPTIAPRQFGSDPRFDALRASGLIEDRRPTALLLRTRSSQ